MILSAWAKVQLISYQIFSLRRYGYNYQPKICEIEHIKIANAYRTRGSNSLVIKLQSNSFNRSQHHIGNSSMPEIRECLEELALSHFQQLGVGEWGGGGRSDLVRDQTVLFNSLKDANQ